MIRPARPGPFVTLERVASAPIGWQMVAVWALAEAIVVPVVPDVLLCILVLAAPRRVATLFLAVLAGAMAGSLILYAFAVVAPEAARSMVLAVPGVRPEMLAQATVRLAGGDPLGMAGFGPGTPLKVDTVAWAMGSGGPVGLALGVVVNRVTRIGPVVLVAFTVGRLAPDALRRWQWPVIAVYGAAWLALYVVYLR